tara:strand:+ start:1066 stop:2088 length:1023 start_codon:yes stop_codon:yes gene_type:complete
MNIKLGKIEELSLKSVWQLEEKHFTPWLSKNMDVIGEALGLDIVCLDTELQAGDGQRHVDMLVEINGKHLAIIENQYGKADPSHGWRTLHYSLALGAKVAIWVFEDISSDDERLISFLNEHPDIEIIGVQAKVYQIDDSLPAITFQVIPASQEALFRVKRRAQLKREISSKESFYGEYFPDLISYLALAGVSSGKHLHGHGTPNYHCDWPSPYGGQNKIEAAFRQNGRGEKSYRVQLKLSDRDSSKVKNNFEYLKKYQNTLTKGFPPHDCNFYWKENRKMQFIEFYFDEAVDVDNITSDQLEDIREWTHDIIPKLNANLIELREVQADPIPGVYSEVVAI